MMSHDFTSTSTPAFAQLEWLSTPELAAYRSGRLANQIEHQTWVLWLCGSREADPRLGLPAYNNSLIPWHDLKIAGRHAITDQLKRLTFEQQVDVAKKAWEGQFDCLWRHELLFDQNELIKDERRKSFHEEEGPTLREIIAKGCHSAFRLVDETVRNLPDTSRSACDGELFEMFRLGQHVDRLVHPVPAFAELALSESDVPPRTELTSTPGQIASWGDFPSTAPPESARWQLPQVPLPSTPPSAAWWADILSLAVASGLKSSVVQQLQCVSQGDADDSRSSAQRIVDCIETIVHQSQTDVVRPEDDCLGSVPTEQPKSSPDGSQQILGESNAERCEEGLAWTPFKSVGIEFQLESRAVRKTGSESTIENLTRLQFNALEYIARGGNGFRSRADLEDRWESLGGHTKGESSIESCLSVIRSGLKKIGLKLVNSRGVGWRIGECTGDRSRAGGE